MDIVSMIMMCITMITGCMFVGFVVITAPMSMPYLKAKLSKKSMILLQTGVGNRELITLGKDDTSKKYGAFQPMEDAAFTIGGVKMAFAHVDMAVTPTLDACNAAQKMDDANSDVFSTLERSAENAEKLNIIDKFDARALCKFAANVSPITIHARVERRATELMSERVSADVMKYAIAALVILIGAGVAYSMVASGSTGAVVDSMSSVAATQIMPTI